MADDLVFCSNGNYSSTLLNTVPAGEDKAAELAEKYEHIIYFFAQIIPSEI